MEFVKSTKQRIQFKTTFKGTNIAAGKCRGVVIGTGLQTEIVILHFSCTVIYF